MDLGIYYIDLVAARAFLTQPVHEVIFQIYATVGWFILVFLLLHAGILFYEKYRQHGYMHNWKWVLLAIDIPALNVQTPKAVEQMFAHLAGALNVPNIGETFHQGFKQRWFSFEIISIEGYIQFLVYTEEKFRDLVEGAVYAQYPEAEVIEVEDYVGTAPDTYPNDEYDIWAADFTLTEDYSFPIRTYREFEHSISKDTVLKDPMGTFLESFSRIGQGEQMWFQLLVEPTPSNTWKNHVIAQVKKMIGEKAAHGKTRVVDVVADAPVKILEAAGDAVFAREAGETHAKAEEPKNQLKFLTPGQKIIVEAMELKMAKVGFKTKMRGIYLARKEVFRPERGVNALVGAIQQFNI
ncbi:MAG: hypothetical protein AAB932_01120, partial [Patescibacteria group bacterium]